ncbi:YdeI/OmpD-associated family protein [Leifsonia sp. AG29]|uniref:YdeI/OmpD-associated family protein n=1 Tax=Leifsonia sp. AG29 TaxID=2598860 RepID=UPI00131CD0BB|nr:YdeI/OmpD-associated family protein [Leifsonia sp. AG29]
MAELERITVTDRRQLRDWLEANAAESPGVWLVYPKGAGRSLHYDDIVEEALCVGWVDSLPRKLDDQYSMLRLNPRSPRSSWSKKNKERVESLRARGLMRPAGEAAVEVAVANGTWSRLDEVEQLAEPDDLAAALDADADARTNWDAFPRSARRAILEWLLSAKTDATRQKRIATTVSEAHENRRANQWRQPVTASRAPTNASTQRSISPEV